MSSELQVIQPFGTQGVTVDAGRITAIVSAALSSQSVDGLLITAVFERTPPEGAQRLLQGFLRQLEPSVEAVLASGAGFDRFTLAETLLEPDFRRFTDLASHCREVSVVATRFAEALALPPTQVATIRLAALVHDVGFRLLDYDALHHQPRLTEDQKRVLAEHPIVGAALVEPLLGAEVAQAVLRHHERVDGKGYPSRLTGQQIPLASRVIQIADAWVAMSTQQPYQPALGRQEAISRLREGAGTQFDSALIDVFLQSLSEIVS